MELRHLRYFRIVAEELNMTRAANRLYVAQPPLSRQIRQLETELGVDLFERHSRGLRLTAAGNHFRRQAVDILDRVDAAISSTQALASAGSHVIRIGFVPSFLYEELPALIQRLRAQHDISLTFTELMTVEQVHALRTDRIDIGFGRLVIDDPSIQQETLFEEPLVAVLPTGHRLADRQPSLAELAAEPLIVYPDKPRPSYADTVLDHFHSRDIPIDAAQQANGLQTAIGLVASGIGFTLVPERVRRMRREGIVYCDLADHGVNSPVLASTRRESSSAALDELLAILHTLVNTGRQQGQMDVGNLQEQEPYGFDPA